jgi:ferredoxin--NADP+ reductase
VGVIGTNKKDAADTVKRILEDVAAGAVNQPVAPADVDAVCEWLAERAPGAVRWDGWVRIDQHERSVGEPLGRPRVKLVGLEEMVAIAGGTRVGS